MVRLLFSLYFVGVLLINTLFNESVNTSIIVPSQVEAGKDFTVNLTINKGAIEGFSRLQHNLPAGLSAKPATIENAEFYSTDKKIRLVWLKIPEKNQLILSYKINVDQRLKGVFNLTGNFSYIEGNERKSITFNSENITITPSPILDPKLIVDINDFEKYITPDLSTKDNNVACIRQAPTKIAGSNDIIIKLLVYKGERGKFAKIEEKIPSGFVVEPIDTRSAIFTSKDNTVKFLWMNMPAEDYFTVSYKLRPKPEVNINNVKLNGSFSYIEGNQTITLNTIERSEDFSQLDKEKILALIRGPESSIEPNNLFASTENMPVKSSKVQQTTTPTELPIEKPIEKPIEQTIKEPIETPLDKPIIEKKDTAPIISKKPLIASKPIVKQNVKTNAYKSNYAGIELLPDTGIYYRVQLAAGHRPINISRYFKKHKLEFEVKREQHDGWYKYSIGSFRQYIEARDYRSKIWTTTTISDAFVAAYNRGQRITVQEALMISNQKWYK